jgi:hypothetical protein
MSRFSEILGKMIDGSKLFTRAEWGEIINESEADIERWLRDEGIPNPSVLKMIVSLSMERDGQDELRIEWKKFSEEPFWDVSPLWRVSMGSTFGKYLVLPLLEGFTRILQTVSPEEQERILYAASAEVHKLYAKA